MARQKKNQLVTRTAVRACACGHNQHTRARVSILRGSLQKAHVPVWEVQALSFLLLPIKSHVCTNYIQIHPSAWTSVHLEVLCPLNQSLYSVCQNPTSSKHNVYLSGLVSCPFSHPTHLLNNQYWLKVYYGPDPAPQTLQTLHALSFLRTLAHTALLPVLSPFLCCRVVRGLCHFLWDSPRQSCLHPSLCPQIFQNRSILLCAFAGLYSPNATSRPCVL